MSVVREAQALGEMGLRVHPLRDKAQPLTKYTQTATSDPDAIAQLFAPFPRAIIGIATGDGIVAIDDDRGLAAPDASMPTTLTASTPSRGWHFLYSCATPVRNSASKVAPGIDVRGIGGYIAAPPAEGRAWVDRFCSIAPLPGILLAACLRSAPSAGEFEPRTHVPAGERHDYLVRFAGWALANDLADTADGLLALTFEHAMQVCEQWPGGEQAGVYDHVRSICRWVIARESGQG